MTTTVAVDLPTTLAFTAGEALMWQVEGDPSLQFRIVGIVGLAHCPEEERLLARVERLTRLVPRLRHRVVPGPVPGLRPHWELDPQFDLGYHFRRVHLPQGSDEDVLELASLARQDDFPLSRPPWRMILVTGLTGGRAALVLTMNHVITDGIGALHMGSLMFDLDAAGPDVGDLAELPEVADPRQRTVVQRILTGLTQEVDQVGGVRRLVRGAVGSVRDPEGTGRSLLEAAGAAWRFAQPKEPGSPLPRNAARGDRFLTLDVSLTRLRDAARVCGGRVNDAYLAALVGGMRRYHDLHDLPMRDLTITIPVNTRSESSTDPGGNSVLLKICTVPADISDPAARIAAIAAVARRERTTGSHALTDLITQTLGRLPSPLTRSAIGTLADGLDFATTNVPGAPVQLYLAGAPVTSMHAFINRGRCPMTAALISYNGTAHIALTLDPVAVPDGEQLVSCIQAELDAVMALADHEEVELLSS